jgi:hypothetical protein
MPGKAHHTPKKGIQKYTICIFYGGFTVQAFLFFHQKLMQNIFRHVPFIIIDWLEICFGCFVFFFHKVLALLFSLYF